MTAQYVWWPHDAECPINTSPAALEAEGRPRCDCGTDEVNDEMIAETIRAEIAAVDLVPPPAPV